MRQHSQVIELQVKAVILGHGNGWVFAGPHFVQIGGQRGRKTELGWGSNQIPPVKAAQLLSRHV
jgi:hypothetical protein